MSEIICNNTTTFLARRLFDNGESLECKSDTYKRVGTIEGLITTLTITGRDKNIYSFRIIDEQRQPYKDLTRIICNRLGGEPKNSASSIGQIFLDKQGYWVMLEDCSYPDNHTTLEFHKIGVYARNEKAPT